MPDIAELGLSMDTRQLVEGDKALDALGETATKVEKKVDGVAASVEKLGEASAAAKAKTADGASAVDAVGEASTRTAQKVGAASAAVDGLGEAARRIRIASTAGEQSLDGFMNSSVGVWRNSEAAARAMDSLGASVQRTSQQWPTNNGSMEDTARIMRQAAEASRALEESNIEMLKSLQGEINMFGLARGELERYKAAELGLSNSAQMKAMALGNSIDAMHREEQAARDSAAAQDRATQAGERFLKTLKDQVDTLGMNAQQLQAHRAAQLGVSDAAAPMIKKLDEAGAGAHKFSLETAGAKRELLVLAHELSQGQFQKFGGSMMVLGEQTGAAGLLFSATGLAALGLAAAIGVVVHAMFEGAKSQREMSNALIGTNNYAGTTSDGLNNLAHAATEAGGSLREAKKVVIELADTGKFTSEQIGYITSAVIALEHAGSSSVKKTIAEFESLAVQMTGNGARSTEAITRAALKLDDTYHFLTIEVYAYIRALEKEGDQKGASALATKEFAKATEDGARQMVENLGSVARAWHSVAEGIGAAMDAIGKYGQKATAASDVQKFSFRLAEFDKGLAESNVRLGRPADYVPAGLEEARTRIVMGLTAAVEKLNIADAEAIAQGNVQQEKSALLHDMQRMQAADDKRKEEALGRLNVELAKNLKTEEKLRALKSDDPLINAMITPEAIEARRLATIKEFSKKPTADKVDRVENIELSDRIKQYDREASLAKDHYANLAKLDDMYLRAGELGDEQYYANKVKYTNETYAAQVDTYQQQVDALKSHNSTTQAEAAQHAKQLKEIQDKQRASAKEYFAELGFMEEEERLRKAGIVAASDEASGKYIFALNQEAKKIEEANRAHGKAATFLEREEIARLDLAIAYQKQFMRGQEAAGATDEEIAQAPKILQFLEDQRAARARLANAVDQQDLIAKNYEANKKMWESIDSTAHDTFVSIFDSGKSAFDRLRDTLKNGLLDLLYQMTIKKWIFNIGASVTGAGMGGVANAGDLASMAGATGGMAGGIGSTVGLINSAKNAYTIATQGFAGVTAGMGTSMVSLGTMFGSSALEAFGAGFGSTGLVGAADAAGLYAASGGVGSAGAVTAGAYAGAAVTAAAGIAAGVIGGNMISGQYGSTKTVNIGTGVGAIAGAFMGGPIGAAIGGAIGGIIGGIGNRAFGMGDKRYGDTGITGTLTGTGFSGEEYAKWTQKGGYFRSDKADTDRKAVDATTSNAFIDTYAAIRKVSATLAETLGVDTSSLATRSQALNINLTGLKTEAERLEAVTKFFVGVGNDIAVGLVPNIASFKVGTEELSATLERVSHNYAGVDMVLQLIGRTSQEAFGAVGVASIGARESLIKLAGGLDALSNGTAFFSENFLTEAERMGPVLSTVADTLAKLGMSGVKTTEDYKKVVLGLDLSSTAGQEMYIKLLALAPAFKAATDYTNQLAIATGDYAAVIKTAAEIASEHLDLQKQLNELTKSEAELLAIQRSSIADVNRALFDQVQAAKAVVSAKDALAKAYDRESTATAAALDKSKAWVTTLNGLNASLALGSQSTLTPEQKYAEARAQFEKTLAAANAGDATAQSGLSAAEQAFLTASQVVNASDAKYAADYARVMAANDEALKWAGAQVDVQQASLDALKAQVSGLITINDSVLTVAQAIAKLQAAMGMAGGLGVKFDGSHAGGLANVPFDGYAAELHQGEVVVDAQAASAMRRYFGGAPSQGGGNTDALVAEIKGLLEEVKGLRADQAKQTGATIQANQEANANAAKTVVSGVEKSSKKSAWNNKVEYAE